MDDQYQPTAMENPPLSPIRDRDDNLESLKKCPRQRHSTELKLDCINRFEKGEKMGPLSVEYGVAKCTVRSWVKNKTNLLTPRPPRPPKIEPELSIKQEPGVSEPPTTPNGLMLDTNGDAYPPLKPKAKPRPRTKPKIIARENDIPQLVNNSLLKWYENCRLRGIPVTRKQFEEKADHFFKKHGIDNFYMTNEWLVKWCKHHGFKVITETMQSIPICQTTDSEFQRELKHTLGCPDYQKPQVFNCSVLSWNYKTLPQSLSQPADKDHRLDDYMRVFSFSNADLSLKIPLICTLNSGKKKLWKNEFNLPLYSTESDGERLDSTVFSHWLNQEFSPHVMKFLDERNLPPKALLLLDRDMFDEPKLAENFPGLKILVVSKSSSFLVRPFDSELVDLMKNCKRSFLRKVGSMIQENSGSPLAQHLEGINNGHFLAWIKMHWRRGPDGISELTDTELVRCLPGGRVLSLDVIERWFKRCQSEVREKKEAVVIKSEVEEPISGEEARDYLNKLVTYFSFHNLLPPEEMAVLSNAQQRVSDMLELKQLG